ncbi:MAG: hypothetical protein ABJC09_04170 [Terriglobia bacterium]
MKLESDCFEGRKAELIYIAGRLPDATRLESILTAGGIDYAVEAEEYQAGVVFRRTRVGAFFYVPHERRDHALSLMAAAGYKPLSTK